MRRHYQRAASRVDAHSVGHGMIAARRIGERPIIHRQLSASVGENINGPSLIARPDWAPGPGRYLLYFAHHYGTHIRLAFSDRLEGPWHIHRAGVVHLETTPFVQTPPELPQPDWAIEWNIDAFIPHVASPDVHVNEEARRLEMLFHGLAEDGEQKTFLATSTEGIDWQVEGSPTEQTYLRRFTVNGVHHAIGLGGQLLRAEPGGCFELGSWPLPERVRHVAVLKRGPVLHVLYTRIWDAPERIFHTSLDLSGDWRGWAMCREPCEVLVPERNWEGAGLPITQSTPGQTPFSRALRDPAWFEEEGVLWLVYAGGGEAALGLAVVTGI